MLDILVQPRWDKRLGVKAMAARGQDLDRAVTATLIDSFKHPREDAAVAAMAIRATARAAVSLT